MNNSALMLAAIHDGDDSDPAVCAALDALRGELDRTYMAAVLEVARVYLAGRDSREIAEAARLLRSGARYRDELMALIVTECPSANEEGDSLVTILAGDDWPRLLLPYPSLPEPMTPQQHIGVGARWVIGRAAIVRQNRRRDEAARRAAGA